MHSQFGSVAQLNRVLDYGSSGSRFESWRSHEGGYRKITAFCFISFVLSLPNSLIGFNKPHKGACAMRTIHNAKATEIQSPAIRQIHQPTNTKTKKTTFSDCLSAVRRGLDRQSRSEDTLWRRRSRAIDINILATPYFK